MKKPFYILMIAVLITNVGCKKDSNEPDPGDSEFPAEITTADLDGTWEFKYSWFW